MSARLPRNAGTERLPRRLVIACVGSLVGAAALGAIAYAPAGQRGTALIVLHLAMTGAMLLAWSARPSGRGLAVVLATGVVARLFLVTVPAFTTHDVERYLWDGFVARSGFDPYRLAPREPALDVLAVQWPRPRDNTSVPTLYPPLALCLFAFCSLFGVGMATWLWKGLMGAASILTLLLGARWLRRTGRAEALPVLALSPLLLIETVVGAHLDALTALAIVVALVLVDRGHAAGRRVEDRRESTGAAERPHRGRRSVGWTHDGPSGTDIHSAHRGQLLAGIALGLGALVKIFPALVVAPLLLGRGFWRVAVGASLTLALGYGAALSMDLRPIGSVPIFLERWRFGSPLFALVEGLWDSTLAMGLMGVTTLVGLAASVLVARRSIASAAMLAASAPMIAGPVVFPWYLVPLGTLVAGAPSVTALAWITTVPFTYEVLDAFDADGTWTPASWPLAIIGSAVLVGAVGDALWLRRRRRAEEGARRRNAAMSR